MTARSIRRNTQIQCKRANGLRHSCATVECVERRDYCDNSTDFVGALYPCECIGGRGYKRAGRIALRGWIRCPMIYFRGRR